MKIRRWLSIRPRWHRIHIPILIRWTVRLASRPIRRWSLRLNIVAVSLLVTRRMSTAIRMPISIRNRHQSSRPLSARLNGSATKFQNMNSQRWMALRFPHGQRARISMCWSRRGCCVNIPCRATLMTGPSIRWRYCARMRDGAGPC